MNKRIGVIYCEGQGYYQTKLIRGINSRAHELGYDVVVFTNFVKACHNIDIELCENNIFYLINFDEFDGIIVGADTLRQSRMETEIYEILKKKCSCPVVVVDCVVGHDYPTVVTDDTGAFEQVVSHFIEVHGCRDILFFSGPDSIASTVSRLKGYEAALTKHGIPVRDELISFEGDFWYDSGERLARDIAEGKRKKPDAIVFSGDYMAIGAINKFSELGIDVPGDIRIAGYDAVEEAIKISVPVTSYDPPVVNTGIMAVNRLLGIEDEPAEEKSGLCIGTSCGCEEDLNYTKRMYFETSELDAMKEFMASTMLDEVVTEEGLSSLCTRIQYFLYLIKDYKDFYLCLSGEWVDFSDRTRESEFHHPGFSENMLAVIDTTKEFNRKNSFYSFSRDKMLPAFYEEHSPTTFYMVPVYLGRKNFGYAALTLKDNRKSFDSSFRNWIKHAALALEIYRTHGLVTDSVSKDILTDVYTRAGFMQRSTILSIALMSPENSLLVAVIDVDGLKKINDELGHDMGDAAIKAAAGIIKKVLGEQEIATRTGGDEFTIVGCRSYKKGDDTALADLIIRETGEFNSGSTLPFKLSISVGVVIENTNSFDEYDALYKEADRRMYRMKKKHHGEI